MNKIHDEGIKDREKFLKDSGYTEEKLNKAISEALKKIDYAMETLGDKFASHNSVNGVYLPVENDGGWNCGFWTGMLWIAYELTGDEKYRKLAERHIPTYYRRIKEKIGVNHHDMGFVFIPSCVAAYKLTGNEQAKEAALMAVPTSSFQDITKKADLFRRGEM